MRSLQRRLRRAGQNPGPLDGLFGARTEAAVRSFQEGHGLAIDGIVGAATRGALARRLTAPSTPRRRIADRQSGASPQSPKRAGNANANANAKANANGAPRKAARPAPSPGAGQRPSPKQAGSGSGLPGPGLVLLIAGALALALVGLALGAGLPTGRPRGGPRASREPAPEPSPAPVGVAGPALSPREVGVKEPAPAPAPARVGVIKDPEPGSAPAPRPRAGAGARRRAVEPANSKEVRAATPMLGYAIVPAPVGEVDRRAELREQAAMITAECAQRGLELVELVREREPQNGKGLERPGLGYAFGRVAAGEARGLVISELSRLSRSAAELGAILEWFNRSGARLVAVAQGIDTDQREGRLAARALIEVSRWERERLSERTQQGLQAARLEGRRSGRRAVADDPVLRERIARMRGEGMTLQAIADRLNEAGVPTVRGGAKWRPSSVHAAAGYKRRPRSALDSLPGPAPADGEGAGLE